MCMKNTHCSYIFLSETSCIAPWGPDEINNTGIVHLPTAQYVRHKMLIF